MLNHWLNEQTICIRDRVADWQQALVIAAKPLLAQGIIHADYVPAIIHQHHKLGPYYVLAPGLAMPHARPEEGAHGQGLALLKLHQGVAFGAGEFDPVSLIIMLAAPDADSHIVMISSLAELFSCPEDLAALHQAQTLAQINNIISRY
ncbi:PTS sugar transporter subunit IIA [Shimwellia blattae]|uniref:Putative sugar phosphotransferase component IIA n=1 Tax=Shimwellia blattae (strain ATCC 29907 / DSM 4481 / JCM 1650 / NBRC 105725 / CDC 9005-74) TaxID=630626 RepID=I2B746_SHIBC|nr:PTS sugar transporter subunit IIA [Shimwellia blattae]AFJ46350.1 putative sugar phosphotransferase component IIA [Shimwellia blattae DSM 4481 = NBRC 105725]GAB79933.1 ascorbate-specific phosphotransferase system enzyme IIA component [Shimwellia blattae DSM 4481 = NBRC 105725]VDY63816.1 Mannitol-specific cryptic phosphotransferase enzyme IIA component [Shimwellia blattae]VEC21954.1 Mannitol-specific cryptic phosphotransferase enzyme IIA component [Shimwellia blattae]